MKFNLTANAQEKDGFQLRFDATTKEELSVCKELAEKIVEKIKSIEVKVVQETYDD